MFLVSRMHGKVRDGGALFEVTRKRKSFRSQRSNGRFHLLKVPNNKNNPEHFFFFLDVVTS
jgi:hypothetical protein